MLKKAILIGALALWAAPAQAVLWSTAGANATHIPIINIADTMNGPANQFTLNNTVIAEILPASAGKEILDVKVNETRTGFKGGFPTGAGTITTSAQVRIYSRTGRLLKATPFLRNRFAFPAAAAAPWVDDAEGIANYGAKKYVVQALKADLAPYGKPGQPYRPAYSVILQVVDIATGKRVKLFRFKSAVKSRSKIFGIEVNDVNADGKDDLVVRYDRPAGKRSLQTTIIYDLGTGKRISVARYWL